MNETLCASDFRAAHPFVAETCVERFDYADGGRILVAECFCSISATPYAVLSGNVSFFSSMYSRRLRFLQSYLIIEFANVSLVPWIRGGH